jgi:hypothetical protein
MKNNECNVRRWWVVVVFAVAMAWVEAAVVYYLRTMVNRIEPYQQEPFPLIGGLGRAELVREAATLIMLLCVGSLAGRSRRSRLGFAAVAFGFWDIFYYVFLKVMCGFPHSLRDWDILFLLPLPWWGPVLAPVLIALLMIVWGTVASTAEPAPLDERLPWKSWLLNAGGVGLALYVFMADALRVAPQGSEAVRNVLPLPHSFNWPLFIVALFMMAAPLARLAWIWPRPIAGEEAEAVLADQTEARG